MALFPLFRAAAGLCLALLVFLPAPVKAQEHILITEFQARNKKTLNDADRIPPNYPDWLELYNAGTTTCDLSGWYLTDDPMDLPQWRFPDGIELEPGGFLLIFASGADLWHRPREELHTNFCLRSSGDYLALVKPDGVTPVCQYGPDFPPQRADFSYGMSMNSGSAPRLVESNCQAKALVPSDGTLGLSWTQLDFDDNGWKSGNTGVGYDEHTGYDDLVNLDLEDEMEGVNSSVYVRIPFELESGFDEGVLVLWMKYDDGFIAYINGEKVAEANPPANPSWNSRAGGSHRDSEAVVFERFHIKVSPDLLKTGENVLAIHGLNYTTGSSDMLILPELSTFDPENLVDPESLQYFDHPTPGYANVSGYDEIAEKPEISPPIGVFAGEQTIETSVDSPGAEIRYTISSNFRSAGGEPEEPTENSELYTGPFKINTSSIVQAKAFQQGIPASATATARFMCLGGTVPDFTSDVPIVLIDDFGRRKPGKPYKVKALFALFEPKANGRASLANEPDIITYIGIKRRGSSTFNREKASYTVESREEDDEDKPISPLGLPPETDWILYGAYNFDLALMRNALIYDLSNQIGRYAVRTRFVEFYFNMYGGDLSNNDYYGVYSFMEKIKRNEKRVDIERLSASALQEPEITGGYELKIDRLDPWTSYWSTRRQNRFFIEYPKERYTAPEQLQWIKRYMQEAEDALFSSNFRDPEEGYAPYIDVDSWVDHNILNALAMNVDAYRLSGYWFKDREGKIEHGPIWDFDRSMGSTDGRDSNPRRWYGTGDSSHYISYDGRYPWIHRLWQDPDAMQRWIDRWYELRRKQLSTENINATIDRMADTIEEAQVRNFQRWRGLSSNWSYHVRHLKQWLETRANWIDSQFIRPPEFSKEAGLVLLGTEIAISGPTGTIYFTDDGSDPRLRGGDISPKASVYSEPVNIAETTTITARVKNSRGEWSGVNSATFVITPKPLVITEIMYNPKWPPSLSELPSAELPFKSPFQSNDFEFIELYNRGRHSVNLSGARLVGGAQYEFQVNVLPPNSRVLLVENIDAFKTRYKDVPEEKILGEYAGALNNRRERLIIKDPSGKQLLSFEYNHLWHPSTDGDGYSLCAANPMDPTDPWGEKEGWRPSTDMYGSPGKAEPGSGGPGGLQLPGDANQDGRFDLSDVVGLVRITLSEGSFPLPCEGSTPRDGGNLVVFDLNGDEKVDVADAIYAIDYLFQQGPAPVNGTECIPVEGCSSACLF